jgi:DNA recombination-dependent growth factor C
LGLQQGSVSLARYRLLGAGGRHTVAKLNGLLEPHKAAPLKLGGVHKEELVGWVRPAGLDGVELPPEAPWDLSHCAADDGFVLRLRIERRKVPAQLLQLLYKQRFHEAAEKTGKAPGPKDRRDLRESLRRELTGRALPALTHVDAYWRDRAGELTVFTTGKRARDLFTKIFAATFAAPLGESLVGVDPPLLGLRAADWDAWEDSAVASAALGRLSSATPVAFAEQHYP